MVSMKDIAEACKVSVSTVSRALNGVHGISAPQVDLIRQTARRMGYIPNEVARTLKTSRSWMIAVLYDASLTHPFFSILLDAIRTEAEACGYDLIFLSRKGRNGKDYSDSALCRATDGVVIVYVDAESLSPEKLMASGIPVVSVDDCNRNCPLVVSDYRQGTRELVRLAVSRGHRRIALIHGEMGYATHERLQGFSEEMKVSGLSVPSEYIRAGHFQNGDAAAEHIRTLLKLPEPPTCILLPDDTSAESALRLLHADGLECPRDFSCIGYDGTLASRPGSLALTTYQQDFEGIAREVVRLLLSLTDHAEPPRKDTLIRGKILEGDTLAEI